MWIFSQIQSNENIGLAKFSPSADSSDPSVTSFNPTLHFWIRKLYLRQIKLLKIKIYIPKICLYTDNMIEGIWQVKAYWTGNSGLYLWKEQEFKKVEEVWPPKMKNKVGHTSLTILNSCSFQRYRPLLPTQ